MINLKRINNQELINDIDKYRSILENLKKNNYVIPYGRAYDEEGVDKDFVCDNEGFYIKGYKHRDSYNLVNSFSYGKYMKISRISYNVNVKDLTFIKIIYSNLIMELKRRRKFKNKKFLGKCRKLIKVK